MSAKEAVKAIVAFFESTITPENEDEDGENETEHDESAGVVELYIRLQVWSFSWTMSDLMRTSRPKGKGP